MPNETADLIGVGKVVPFLTLRAGRLGFLDEAVLQGVIRASMVVVRAQEGMLASWATNSLGKVVFRITLETLIVA